MLPNVEEWDDKNAISGDGCSSNWKIEIGFAWTTDYSNIINSKWFEVWGDGKDYSQYQWDDGNRVNGDGWDSNCNIEMGFKYA